MVIQLEKGVANKALLQERLSRRLPVSAKDDPDQGS